MDSIDTIDDFHNFKKNNTILVIDCWAPWCTPCLSMIPLYEKLANDYTIQNKIKFVKFNVDTDCRLPCDSDIQTIPAFAVFSANSDKYRFFTSNEFNNMCNLIDKIYQKMKK